MGNCQKLQKYQQDEQKVESDSTVPTMKRFSDRPLNAIAMMNESDYVCAGDDGVVYTLNGNAKIHRRAIQDMVCDENNIYTCSRDTSVKITAKDKLIEKATLQGHELSVSGIALNDTNTVLASGGRDTKVNIWDISTEKVVYQKKVSRNLTTCMQFCDAHVLLQGSEDLCVRCWDTREASFHPNVLLKGFVYFPLDMDVSQDGHYVFTSSKGFNSVGCEGRLWDRRTGKMVYEFLGHAQDATACGFIAKDTEHFAAITLSKDMTVQVWNCNNGEKMATHHQLDGGMFTSMCNMQTEREKPNILATTFTGNLFQYEINLQTANVHMVSSTLTE